MTQSKTYCKLSHVSLAVQNKGDCCVCNKNNITLLHMPSKKTTISQLVAQYNAALKQLTQLYQLQIKQTRLSPIRQDAKAKFINKLTSQYNSQVQILKNQLNSMEINTITIM